MTSTGPLVRSVAQKKSLRDPAAQFMPITRARHAAARAKTPRRIESAMRMPTIEKMHGFVLKQIRTRRAPWLWYPEWIALFKGKYRRHGEVQRIHCWGELLYLAMMCSSLVVAMWMSGGSVLDWVTSLMLRSAGLK